MVVAELPTDFVDQLRPHLTQNVKVRASLLPLRRAQARNAALVVAAAVAAHRKDPTRAEEVLSSAGGVDGMIAAAPRS